MALEHDTPQTRREENLRLTLDNGIMARASVLKINDRPEITYLDLISTDSRTTLQQCGWEVRHVRQLRDFLGYLLARVLEKPDPTRPAVPPGTLGSPRDTTIKPTPSATAETHILPVSLG